MKRRVLLNKRIGETPLDALQAWRARHPRYAAIPASYAGRLDPMASGKLLILLGEECKKQERYIGLDKGYDIEVLLGVGSDTGDVLGIPSYAGVHTPVPKLSGAISALLGAHDVPYPAFSSRTVNGKPLFLYALEGTLDDIEIPTHTETIYRLTLLDQKELSIPQVRTRVFDLLAHAPRSEEPSKRLGADFRQDEIRAHWDALLRTHPEQPLPVLRLRVTCASGTYMRTLAARIAQELGTSGLALSIHRTTIGRFLPLPWGWGFWYSTY